MNPTDQTGEGEKYDIAPDPIKHKKPGKIEEEVEEVSRELHLNLPGWQNVDWPIRLIALLVMVFGLSTLGSALGDVFSPSHKNFGVYLLQIIIGIAFVAIAYGLTMRYRWAVWLYGLVAIIGIAVNPLFAIIPAVVLVYLYWRRDYFEPSFLDRWAERIFSRSRT